MKFRFSGFLSASIRIYPCFTCSRSLSRCDPRSHGCRPRSMIGHLRSHGCEFCSHIGKSRSHCCNARSHIGHPRSHRCDSRSENKNSSR